MRVNGGYPALQVGKFLTAGTPFAAVVEANFNVDRQTYTMGGVRNGAVMADSLAELDEDAGTTDDRQQGLYGKLYRASCLATVLFNTLFAALTIITLCGIVFITKPKQVMHDLPPWAWLPLLVVMAPAQAYSQLLAWRTIAAGAIPTPPAIAAAQIRFPALLRPLIATVWLVNFGLGVGIVVSLSKPQPGMPMGLGEVLLLTILAFWLSFAANVYLQLAVKTLTDDKRIHGFIARRRLVIDIAVTILAIVYYF